MNDTTGMPARQNIRQGAKRTKFGHQRRLLQSSKGNMPHDRIGARPGEKDS